MAYDENILIDGIIAATESGAHPRAPKKLVLKQRLAIKRLVQMLGNERRFACIEQVAYFIATVAHETDFEFAAVHEKGGERYFTERYEHRRDIGNVQPGDGARFHGRGMVQDTGRANYAKAGEHHAAIGTIIHVFDVIGTESNGSMRAFERVAGNAMEWKVTKDAFLREPDLMLVPIIAYENAVHGATTGKYTGKKFGDYIKPGYEPDFLGARRVINGRDCAEMIAALAFALIPAIRAAMSAPKPEAATAPPNTEKLPEIKADAKIIDPSANPAQAEMKGSDNNGRNGLFTSIIGFAGDFFIRLFKPRRS